MPYSLRRRLWWRSVKLALTIALLCAHVASQAAVVAVLQTAAGTILLHDVHGPCIENARLAEFLSADAQRRIPGCYLVGGGDVRIAFLDGDVVEFPIAALRKPTSL
jgi:hypothetical protein